MPERLAVRPKVPKWLLAEVNFIENLGIPERLLDRCGTVAQSVESPRQLRPCVAELRPLASPMFRRASTGYVGGRPTTTPYVFYFGQLGSSRAKSSSK